jgi:glutathione peroxidase
LNSNIYDFEARSLNGRILPLKEWEGKVILIVNTASKCGFTPQYKDLENLYEKYKEIGFLILGFPCNQFGSQEPGTSEEIAAFCELNFGVTFPMFSKIDVNGKNAHPLYKFLKEKLPGIAGTMAIKWNFTKFLVNKQGIPIKRYAPKIIPSEFEQDILDLLDEY